MSTLYAINTATFGVSEYLGMDLVGVADVGGQALFMAAGGLAENVGDSDDGTQIDAHVQTGALVFGDRERRKFCREARVYGRSPRGLRLVTVTHENGRVEERAYSVRTMDGDADRGRRVRLGGGVRAIAWGIRIENVNGGELDLRGLALAPVATKATR